MLRNHLYTPALLGSFLQGRQRREEAAAAAAGQSLEQVQLAVAAELIHNYGCCQKATLACINQSRQWYMYIQAVIKMKSD